MSFSFKPCSDERKNGFNGLKLKRYKFLQPFFTPCEHDCFCLKTLKHFRFKCLRRFLKINFFWFLKTVLRTFKTSFKKLTTCSIDFLLFFVIEMEIIKANENHINISYENYICFEASGLWHRCFPVNFVKFQRTPFFKEHLWWLLLVVLSKFAKWTGKHLCQSLLLIKGVLAQMFSCKFCEIFKYTFFHQRPLVATSILCQNSFLFLLY